MRKSLPAGHYAFASLISERSLNAVAEGDIPEGMRLADEAVAIAETSIKNGRAGAILMPTLLVRAIQRRACRPSHPGCHIRRGTSSDSPTGIRGTRNFFQRNRPRISGACKRPFGREQD